MSLYHMVAGVNPSTFTLLPALGHHPDEFPRFRDCFYGDPERPKTEDKMIIYTRTGGGNREAYEAENEWIKSLPGFLFDYDDDFDNTYANWVFDIPEEWKADVDLFIQGRGRECSDAYLDRMCEIYPKLADKFRETLRGEKNADEL